jgi:hypothetical protein
MRPLIIVGLLLAALLLVCFFVGGYLAYNDPDSLKEPFPGKDVVHEWSGSQFVVLKFRQPDRLSLFDRKKGEILLDDVVEYTRHGSIVIVVNPSMQAKIDLESGQVEISDR